MIGPLRDCPGQMSEVFDWGMSLKFLTDSDSVSSQLLRMLFFGVGGLEFESGTGSRVNVCRYEF